MVETLPNVTQTINKMAPLKNEIFLPLLVTVNVSYPSGQVDNLFTVYFEPDESDAANKFQIVSIVDTVRRNAEWLRKALKHW